MRNLNLSSSKIFWVIVDCSNRKGSRIYKHQIKKAKKAGFELCGANCEHKFFSKHYKNIESVEKDSSNIIEAYKAATCFRGHEYAGMGAVITDLQFGAIHNGDTHMVYAVDDVIRFNEIVKVVTKRDFTK